MQKIKEIIIGTNNHGKYREISNLLPNEIIKHSPEKLNINTPEETGKTFKDNSFIKASYFSKKTNLVCISDDSGLEIDLLNGNPGIYSSRWNNSKKNFNHGIKRIFKELNSIKNVWQNECIARFVCSLTIYWPNGVNYSAQGIVKGKISNIKKGKNGFGYDPIFIPDGYNQTFGEMKPSVKMSLDHRHKAFLKIKKFFAQ
jgi:XTP/dITP diphosphohydrolase|tara:strand:- start:46 stop:645 length:600 start_codon:yes stop_codon:yes gene_type:complete